MATGRDGEATRCGRWRELPHRRPRSVVLAWVAASIGFVLFAPALGDVAVRDDSAFLPSSAPSQRAEAVLERVFPGEVDRRAAIVVLSRPGGLRPGDTAYAAALARELSSARHRGDVGRVVAAATDPEQSAFLRSSDGEAELLVASLRGAPFGDESSAQLSRLRGRLAATAPAGLRHEVTGPAALAADQADVVLESFERTALVTVLLVLAILVLVYRSLVAPLVPLVTIGLAFLVARGVIAIMADHGLDVALFTETFMIVLVFGAGTDYCLLLVSRYREELAGGGDALPRTVRTVTGVVLASGATVIAGELALGAAEFGMVRTMGPSVALAVAVTVVAALTLTPALVRLAGGSLFWPARAPAGRKTASRFARLGRLVSTRPAPLLVGGVLVLGVPALGTSSLRASLDAVDDLPSSAEAKQGFATLSRHFPGGRLSPVSVVVRSSRPVLDDSTVATVDRLTDRLRREPGIAEVRSITQPAGAPLTSANVGALGGGLDVAAAGIPSHLLPRALDDLRSSRGLRLDGPLLRASPSLTDVLAPFLGTDGRTTRLIVTLRGNPYRDAAFDRVRVLDDVAREVIGHSVPGSDVLVGGPVALSVDMKDINDSDFRRIAVLLAVGVALVLALLLRSLVAPLYLLAAILLAFAAVLGLLVVLFQGILGQAGVSSPAPTFLFVILVALGADYSIFLTARVREELAAGREVRAAVATAVTQMGPVVLAAAAILAGTFAALMSVDMPMLRQVGLAVTIGVFLDAFVACSVIIPAATVLAGRAAFWPGLRTRRAVSDEGIEPALGPLGHASPAD